MEATSRCYLLELPKELRLCIYDFIYDGEYGLDLEVDINRVVRAEWHLRIRDRWSRGPRHYAALSKTCRFLHNEVTSPMLQGTHFALSMMPRRKWSDANFQFGSMRRDWGLLKRIKTLDSIYIWIDIDIPGRCDKEANAELSLFWTPRASPGIADPIIKALDSLDCGPGAVLNTSQYVRGPRYFAVEWNSANISRDIYDSFVTKHGLVDKTDSVSPGTYIKWSV
ncbi:hypothetical protein LTR56_011470 [Elasticomyces elasticus]|nr:hypothetical protein LTR56_011470 [Elasticomyces elasticus]KAK3655937.1 hypothetical protein LTR22_009946 [Elasticomyces elasticus]KAK5760092.1 hypothetical protein LTS12_009823 [Elasticomyces elasticus]